MKLIEKYSEEEVSLYLEQHQPTVPETFDLVKAKEIEDKYVATSRLSIPAQDMALLKELKADYDMAKDMM